MLSLGLPVEDVPRSTGADVGFSWKRRTVRGASIVESPGFGGSACRAMRGEERREGRARPRGGHPVEGLRAGRKVGNHESQIALGTQFRGESVTTGSACDGGTIRRTRARVGHLGTDSEAREISR